MCNLCAQFSYNRPHELRSKLFCFLIATSCAHGTATHYKMSEYYNGPEVVRSKAQENTVEKIRNHVENWKEDINMNYDTVTNESFILEKYIPRETSS